MPVPVVSGLCIELVVSPQQLCVQFPGGSVVCAQLPTVDLGTPLEVVKQLLAQVNAALAPLGPIFNILDVCVAVGNCMSSLKEVMIGDPTSFPPVPPFTPQSAANFLDCIPGLIAAINQLLALLPQLSLPILLAQVLDGLIMWLTGLRLQLQALIDEAAGIAASALRAARTGNLQLSAAISCAQANLAVAIQNLNEGMEPLNRLIGVYNTFIGILTKAGVDVSSAQVPTATSISTDITQLQSALQPLDDVIATLTTVRTTVFAFVAAQQQLLPSGFSLPGRPAF